MKTTNAESFAVDSTADLSSSKLKRLGLRSSQRLKMAKKIAPLAPIAPPSVGVATPMKIVPKTRKIRNSGGTMTKVTCCASNERNRKPVILPTGPVQHGRRKRKYDRHRHDQNDKIGAAIRLIAHHRYPIAPEAMVSTASDASPRFPPGSRKPTASGGKPGAASRESLVTTKMYNA